MTRSVSLAVELATLGASFVVVGSTARFLRGDSRAVPRDLDVVVQEKDVEPFVTALHLIGLEMTAVRLVRCADVHLLTGWGPLDVSVGPWPVQRSTCGGGALRVVAA